MTLKRKATMIEERLREWAAGRGYSLAIAETGLLETVRKKVEKRRDDGLIDAAIASEYLNGFRYLAGSAITGARYLVVVAVPSPIHIVPFIKDGKRMEGLLPPTYVRYNRTFADVLADMKDNALGSDAQAEILRAPLKSLAVHMGLARYGRNNITYVPGLGSGLQLCGYVVGTKKMAISASEDKGEGWSTSVLERCVDCRACLKACPTGAIREDRFLISAERCFTYISESRKPFPKWARPPRSLCLIGCMNCQQVCPENKGLLKTEPSGVEFSAEETEAVIAAGRLVGMGGNESGPQNLGAVEGPLGSALAKFRALGTSEDLDVMGRNLEYLLNR
jgi:epoxyqueuosine reductase